MHLLPGVAIQPNLELKTQPKLVLGSLPLAFALPDPTYFASAISYKCKMFMKLTTNDCLILSALY
jgi:hypothetical protein